MRHSGHGLTTDAKKVKVKHFISSQKQSETCGINAACYSVITKISSHFKYIVAFLFGYYKYAPTHRQSRIEVLDRCVEGKT